MAFLSPNSLNFAHIPEVVENVYLIWVSEVFRNWKQPGSSLFGVL